MRCSTILLIQILSVLTVDGIGFGFIWYGGFSMQQSGPEVDHRLNVFKHTLGRLAAAERRIGDFCFCAHGQQRAMHVQTRGPVPKLQIWPVKRAHASVHERRP